MSNYPLIAVIGVTGAGKSRFINTASGRNDLGVGTVTGKVETSYAYVNNNWVKLIDTPGWDDTYRTDTEILKLIGEYLGDSFGANHLLQGVILLQPINVTRVYGTERRRNRLFEKICGLSAFPNIVIATTMWSDVVDQAGAERRVQERIGSPEYWGSMVQGGARVMKHHNTQESALAIIKVLLSKQPKPLLLQNELVQNGGHLAGTSVGIQLTADIQAMNTYNQNRVAELEEEIQRCTRDRAADRAAMRKEIEELRQELYKGQVEAYEFYYYRPRSCVIL